MAESRRFLLALGPGVLFAGAAIGVSHLSQATRAGAGFGMAMVWVVVLACVLKYPAFSFGPRYAAATGKNLAQGYRRQGRGALVLYGLLTLATMFTVEAAVTGLTSGIFLAVFPVAATPLSVSAVLLGTCAALVMVGRYRWLDRIIKVAVVALSAGTLVSAVAIAPTVPWHTLWRLPDLSGQTLFFLALLIGWMPSAIDISIWHSLWTLAKREDTGHAPSVREALFDFDIGYYGTGLLALCFVMLGAGFCLARARKFPSRPYSFRHSSSLCTLRALAPGADRFSVALLSWLCFPPHSRWWTDSRGRSRLFVRRG